MNFKKMLCTLVALVVTPMLFAGNSSPMQVALNDFSARQAATNPVEPEGEMTTEGILNAFFDAINEMLPAKTQKDQDTDKAVKAGLLKLFQDDEASTLNENEQAVINVLFQDIPAAVEELNALSQNKDMTLRQLEEKQAEIATRVDNLFGDVAVKLVNNQTEVATGADKINAERAKQVTAAFYAQLVSLSMLAEMGGGLAE